MANKLTRYDSPGNWRLRLGVIFVLAFVGTAAPVAIAWWAAPVLINGLGPGGAAYGSWLAWALAAIGVTTSLALWLFALRFYGTMLWALLRKGRLPSGENTLDIEQSVT